MLGEAWRQGLIDSTIVAKRRYAGKQLREALHDCRFLWAYPERMDKKRLSNLVEG